MNSEWQRNVAVILAAHGDRAGATPNAALLRHRDHLASHHHFRSVSAGVLKGEPALEHAVATALASGAGRIAVYPFFMADGYFTGKVLPTRIAEAGAAEACRILPPLGLDSNLPALIHAEALAAAHTANYTPADSRLLLVGHGSELGPASANATRAAAERIAGFGGFAEVVTAFLEEPPFLDDQLAGTRLPTIVAGFFSGDGLHAGEDIPQAIRETGANAIYAGPIGGSPAIPGLIAETIAFTLRGA